MFRRREATALALLLLQVCSHAVCVHGAISASHTRGDRRNRYDILPLSEAHEKVRTTCPAPVPYHLAKDGEYALDLKPATLSFLQETSKARTEVLGAGALPSWTCLSLAGGITSFAMSPIFMVAMNSYFIYDQVNIMRKRYFTFRENMEYVEEKLAITAEEEAKEATQQLLSEVSDRLDRVKSDIESIQRTKEEITAFINMQKSPSRTASHSRLFDDGLSECYREAGESLDHLFELATESEENIGSLPYEVLSGLGDIRDLPFSIDVAMFHAKDTYIQLEHLFEEVLPSLVGSVEEAEASIGPVIEVMGDVEVVYDEKRGVRPAKSLEYSAASVLTQRIEELQQDTLEISSSNVFLVCNFETNGIVEHENGSDSDESSTDESLDGKDESIDENLQTGLKFGPAPVAQAKIITSDPCLKKPSVQNTLTNIVETMTGIRREKKIDANSVMNLLVKVEHAQRAVYALKELVANIVEVIGTKSHKMAPYGAIKHLGSFCETLKIMASAAIARFDKPPKQEDSEMGSRAAEMLAKWAKQVDLIYEKNRDDDVERMAERLTVLESSIYISKEFERRGYRSARQVYKEGRSIMFKINALSTMGTRPSDGDYKQLRESLEGDLADFLQNPQDEERGKLFKGLNSLKNSVRKLADQCSARIDQKLFRKEMDTSGKALTVMAEQLERFFERSACNLVYDRLTYELRSVGEGDPMESTVARAKLFKGMVVEACPGAHSRLSSNKAMMAAMRKVEAVGTLSHKMQKSEYRLLRLAGALVYALEWTGETVQYLLGTSLYNIHMGLSYLRTTIEGLAYALSPEALGNLSLSCDGTSAASAFLLALTYTLDQAVLNTMTISDCDEAAYMLLTSPEIHSMNAPRKSVIDK